MANYYGTSRYLCSILDDLRAAHKTNNYSYLPGIIEEIQWAGNRMEAALQDVSDLRKLKDDRAKLIEEIKELKNTKTSLTKKNKKFLRDRAKPVCKSS